MTTKRAERKAAKAKADKRAAAVRAAVRKGDNARTDRDGDPAPAEDRTYPHW